MLSVYDSGPRSSAASSSSSANSPRWGRCIRGSRRKPPKDPCKRGPYYQLSYTWRGHSSTRFVRPQQVEKMRQKVANYKRFRELVNAWVDLAVELERAERAQAKGRHGA